MRYLLPILLMLISTLSLAQIQKEERLTADIIQAFENAQAINDLMENNRLIRAQLEEINHWILDSSFDVDDYQTLKTSYHEYASHMNQVANQLQSMLYSIENTRGMKVSKLQRMFTEFSSANETDLEKARIIYFDQFKPVYEKAALKANSKVGILASLLAIFKVGESIYLTIRDLFETGKLNKEAEQKLLQLAIEGAVKALDRKLRYPTWDVWVANSTQFEMDQVMLQNGYSREFMTYESISEVAVDSSLQTAEVELAYFNSEMSIPLVRNSKRIVVGATEEFSKELPIYSTVRPMKNGDRFWVKLSGYPYASFFYFDVRTQRWHDPYGKSIIVGSENSRSSSTKYLPSTYEFFEIQGNSLQEQFLIIVSNEPLNKDQRQNILSHQADGLDILEKLENELSGSWNHGKNPLNDQGLMNQIAIERTSNKNVFVPMLIQINKN